MRSFQSRVSPTGIIGTLEMAGASDTTHSRTSYAAHVALLTAIGANAYRIVARGWFFSDDFLNFAIARQMGMGWSYLTRSLFGHLEPGHRFVNWLMVELDLGWTGARVITVVGLVLCALLLDWVLRIYKVAAVMRNLSLALFGFALPLSGALIWWSATLNCLPSIAAALIMIGLHKRALDRGTSSPMFLAAFAGFVGTLFYEFTPLTVFFIAGVEYLYQARSRWQERRRPIIVFVTTFTVLQFGYWGYFLAKPYRMESGDPPAVGTLVKYFEWAALRGFGGSVLGIHAADLSRPVAVILELVVAGTFLAVCVASVRSANAIRGVALAAAGTILCHLLVVGVARSRRDGSSAGLDLRYYSDLVWLVPVSFALIGTHLRFAERWHRTARFRLAVAGIVTALCLVSFVSSVRFVRMHPAEKAGNYYRQLAGSIPSDGVSVAGGRVPDALMPAAFFPYNDFHLSIEPYVPGSVHIGSDSNPTSVILPSGRIVPAEFRTLVSLGPQCYSSDIGALSIPLYNASTAQSTDPDLVILINAKMVFGKAVLRQIPDSVPIDYPTLSGPDTTFNFSVEALPSVVPRNISIVLTPQSQICFDQVQVAEVFPLNR